MSKIKIKKVVAHGNLPTRLPVFSTLVMFLTLERFNAPEWLWGTWVFVWVVYWISCIVSMWNQESVDVFEKKD